MKNLKRLLEALLNEIEMDDPDLLEPLSSPSNHSDVGILPVERVQAMREKLRPIVEDLQRHQVRLEAESEIRESEILRISKLSRIQEAEIQVLIESLPDAVILGTNEGVSLVNSSAFRILGISSLDTIRSHQRHIQALSLRWPDGRPMTEVELPFARALRGETVVEEYQGTRPDSGEDFFVRAAAAPIVDSGEILGAVAIYTDITDRRRESQKLKLAYEKADSLNRYLKRQTAEVNAVLDALPDALFIGDMDGLRRCNAQGLRMLGVQNLDEVHGNFRDLVERFNVREADSGRKLSPDETPFGRALKGETMTLNLVQADIETGEDRILRCSAAPVVMDGEVVAAVAVNSDITEEVKAKNEYLNLNAHLGEMVDERTQALTQSNAALERALAEVGRMKERLEAENSYLHIENEGHLSSNEMIGQSNAIKEVFYRIQTVAPQDSTVLILGETGTGKGMLARVIHAMSARKNHPMVMVNCSALPSNLIESELFGREKGAFTGANAKQIGRFELADGGTIFLDEIGDLPLELQAKLLHVIQDKEFSRLGSPHTIKVNVRIIVATNRDLKEEILKGRFREDLFYRLNIFPITIPPLRERKEDIPLLVEFFLNKFCHKMGKEIHSLSAATMKKLVDHSWPGNVRELENIIERAVINTQGDTLQVLDNFDARPPQEAEDPGLVSLSDLERAHILKILKRTQGRIEGANGAAALLGLNPSTLRGRMKKEGIQRFEWVSKSM